jgi:alpha-D-xyloside xylohydrolase
VAVDVVDLFHLLNEWCCEGDMVMRNVIGSRRALAWVVVTSLLLTAVTRAASADDLQRRPDGITLKTDAGAVRLQVWSDRIIRVTEAPSEEFPADSSLSVIAKPRDVKWDVRETPEVVTIGTPALRATVDRKTGVVRFLDLHDQPILQESSDAKHFAPPATQAVSGAISVSDSFVLPADEHVYGLGQHQSGAWNYRGHSIKLLQENREVAIPVLLSSKGYGILWDNPAVTTVDVGVKDAPDRVRWTSEVGKAVDYYFMYGPNSDGVVQDYRQLTGAAPMMGKWVWGFWQCKERYKSQQELIDVVSEYRKRGVPIDGIIQDWQYWKMNAWGSHAFDPTRYPDPAAMVKALHDDLHVHVLISVWPKFDVGTPNYQELEKAGALYDPVIPYVFPKGQGKWYDPFGEVGRRVYWRQISDQLFKLGIDGWWQDASEAELSGKWGEFRNFKTAAGPGAAVFNAYPLMTTTATYQGQRAETDRKRVCILTRSAYAGQQRNSAITWSGDIRGSWDVFAKQIPAGLNFSASGIPYWNTDIGGFFGARKIDPKYQELFTRWFQFGALCPMFRVHGTDAAKELWRWDEPTQAIWKTYANLRYCLLPYIYSVSWQVTNDGGTMMRPLVMDFADDAAALDVGDQFLFGPAIMASPVTQAGATTRPVYLPGKQAWYDFWTGKRETSGQRIDAAAPIQTMPLYVRAGSILPLGPVIQWTAEKSADPIELRVYRGADGTFTLYEDDGETYDYEKGIHATIPLTWNDATNTLTIGARTGEFPGVLKQRTFHVVFVGEGHGAGVGETAEPDKSVTYDGNAVSVTAPK